MNNNKNNNYSSVFLTVNKNNNVAISLDKSLGFVVIGEKKR